MAPNCPVPEATEGSRSTATRVKRGAISLSNSSHLLLMPYSKFAKPVALPAGRARLSTNPAPTGSATCTNTIGIYARCLQQWPRCLGSNGKDDIRRRSATNAATCLRICSASPPPQRVSIRALRPSVQPNCCRPCEKSRNASLYFRAVRASTHEHTDAPRSFGLLRARRDRPRTAAPPSSEMNSRRLHHSITSSARASSVGGHCRGRAPGQSRR